VLAFRGKQVRLGIKAPHGMPIFRKELCDRKLPSAVSREKLAIGKDRL
jgi:sRNA-binding carbon storage regulator CsrA